MPNSDDFLVVAKILVAKDQNSCSILHVYKIFRKLNTNSYVIDQSLNFKLW